MQWKGILCLHFTSQCGDISKSGEGSTSHNKSSPSCRGEEVDLSSTSAKPQSDEFGRISQQKELQLLKTTRGRERGPEFSVCPMSFSATCWVCLIEWMKSYSGLFRPWIRGLVDVSDFFVFRVLVASTLGFLYSEMKVHVRTETHAHWYLVN